MASYHTEMPNTDFAITTINVPDRLDQREVDDRKQEAEQGSIYAQRRLAWRVWVRKAVPWVVLAALAYGVTSWVSNQRAAMAPARISQQLSAAMKLQVHVQDTRLRAAPAPAVVLSGVDFGTRLHVDEIAIEFSAPSLWQALVSGHRRWGDVVVSPVSINFDQARAVLASLALLNDAAPDSVSRVRFKEVRFGSTALLPGRYEATTRRESNGHFSSIILRRSDPPGTMQVQFVPDEAAGNIAFQCDAADWQPPFAPHAPWSEFVAAGKITDAGLDIDKFTLGSSFGGFEGNLSVHRRDHGTPAWLVSGAVSTVGLDVGALIHQLVRPGTSEDDDPKGLVMPVTGTASIDGTLVGGADTLEGALGDMAAEGKVQLRSAAVNGINLGLAASHPAASSSANGGTTRFSDFSAQMVAGAHGLSLRQIRGVAGAMATHGEVTVDRDLNLAGMLHVDLGGTRVQAPLLLKVGGTLAQATYTP